MIAPTIEKLEKKNFFMPDEKRVFDKGEIEFVTVGEVTFGRATLQPGWRWSTCVKPLVNTEYCEAAHLQYQLSGRLHIQMQDGTEEEYGPGDVFSVPPGHDAWVVGSEPVVVIDVCGLRDYAKPS
jgi:hypothetical protein